MFSPCTDSLKAGLSNGGKHASVPFSELEINIIEVIGLKDTICMGGGMRVNTVVARFDKGLHQLPNSVAVLLL